MENYFNGMKTNQKFQQLKKGFQKEPMHGYPQYNNPVPFTLEADLSSTNKAAVLYQKHNDFFLWILPRYVTKHSILCPTHKKRNDSHHNWIQ